MSPMGGYVSRQPLKACAKRVRTVAYDFFRTNSIRTPELALG